MTLEELIKLVIKKSRTIFCFGKYKNIISEHPYINLSEDDQGNINLSSIEFDHYHDGEIVINKNNIRFRPYVQDNFYGTWGNNGVVWEYLIKYDDFEEFIDGSDINV